MSRVLLVPLALMSLAVPAGGTLAAQRTFFSLATSPIPVGHGYRMSVHAWQQNTYQYPARVGLEIDFVKRRGAATQKHQVS